MTRFALPLIVFVVLLGLLSYGLTTDPSVLPSQYIGKPVPVFDLPTLRDPEQRFSNAELAGQVSLVNVWATWCSGCRVEHPFLMELADQGEIPIFAINWRDDRSRALAWLAQFGDPYVMSGFDEDARVGIDWGVYGAPETFLINQQGNVVYRFAGPLNRTLWEREFAPRIEELRK